MSDKKIITREPTQLQIIDMKIHLCHILDACSNLQKIDIDQEVIGLYNKMYEATHVIETNLVFTYRGTDDEDDMVISLYVYKKNIITKRFFRADVSTPVWEYNLVVYSAMSGSLTTHTIHTKPNAVLRVTYDFDTVKLSHDDGVYYYKTPLLKSTDVRYSHIQTVSRLLSQAMYNLHETLRAVPCE